MRKFVLFMMAVGMGTAYADVPDPPAVTTFYGGMKALATTRNANSAYETESKMKDCFHGKDDSGINLPNDFRFFDYDKNSISHDDQILTSNNYVNKLCDFLYKNRVMTVTYQILKNEIQGAVPDYQSYKLATEDAYVSTYIRKTYSLNGVSKEYNDTVITHISSGKIAKIRNGNGIVEDDINSLRIKASYAYGAKCYYEAYSCYERILKKDKYDGDANYRIALMTYFGLGCRKSTSIAKRYIQQAKLSSDRVISSKARNVQHSWKYWNR